MSDENDFEALLRDSSEDSSLVKQLRAALKEQKKQNDATAGALKELKETQEKQTLAKTWDELNVPEKVRKLYSGESDPVKVKAWVEEYREVFSLGEDSGDPAPAEDHADLKSVTDLANLGRTNPPKTSADAVRTSGQQLLSGKKNSNDVALAKWLSENGFPERAIDAGIQ